MREDVSPNRLRMTRHESTATARVGHYLVGHENCNIELLAHFLQFTQHAPQRLLAFGEFASPRIVDAENTHDRVD